MVLDEKEPPVIPSACSHHKCSRFHNKSISGVNTEEILPISQAYVSSLKMKVH
jgi:hypothetical protein